MKKWTKKKILMVIVVPILATLLLAGGVFAAFTFWQGQANVTVQESMAVYVDSAWQTTGTYTWAVNLSSGGTATKIFTVKNNGTAPLGIIPVVTPATSADGKVTTAWTPTAAKTTIAPTAQTPLILTVSASGDAVPAVYGFVVTFTRENP